MADIKRSRKWIHDQIESLNPYEDYAEIFRLSVGYGGNDFMNTLIYCLTFPNFIVTEWGARVVWREDGGKILNKAGERVEQTESKNATWWWYGPHDTRTKESVESINKLHRYWAKQYKGVFSHNDDYIYTLAFTGTMMDRLRKRLGLSGVSDKVKIASHLVMREMVPLFQAEDGVALHSFPSDWDGMVRYCEDYENQPHPGSEQGNLCANAMYDFFAFRFFPRPLRWLGRSIPIALSLPTTLRAHHIEPVNPWLRAMVIWAFGFLFWLQDNVFPDPQVAAVPQMENMGPEDKVQRKQQIQEMDAEYAPDFAKRYSNVAQWGGCPYHQALKVVGQERIVAHEDKMK
ncbi:hypothetical protein PFICI_03626 [Pestalotiopsis fici W106-1]|uniref:ER-bound oxygenase mpaB/mpaB'/Rubber oxygenase catalytic domain-containing protein n=1 Tax=Pestalotiopsis fici (strain W106-1 / CGMCC3.15140) TaxID=1229662 RepID=W3XK35_PESFW|nr:uncharacterized protein PFICI_03626 [Pestalotiopsis fici W106-1]ETS85601.1 hypothetical protein PFICI_03626 [Pestalotiopsis fici W106-1]